MAGQAMAGQQLCGRLAGGAERTCTGPSRRRCHSGRRSTYELSMRFTTLWKERERKKERNRVAFGIHTDATSWTPS